MQFYVNFTIISYVNVKGLCQYLVGFYIYAINIDYMPDGVQVYYL